MRYHEKPKDGVTQTALNACTDCTYIIALCTYTHTHIHIFKPGSQKWGQSKPQEVKRWADIKQPKTTRRSPFPRIPPSAISRRILLLWNLCVTRGAKSEFIHICGYFFAICRLTTNPTKQSEDAMAIFLVCIFYIPRHCHSHKKKNRGCNVNRKRAPEIE